MTSLDKAAVLLRLERITKDYRNEIESGGCSLSSITLQRLDALADDLRKDLVSGVQEVAA